MEREKSKETSQSNGSKTTSGPQDTTPPNSSTLIRQFLIRAGEVYGRQITSITADTYVKLLSDIPLPVLNPALTRVLQESTEWPTVAHIRRAIKASANEADKQAAIEDQFLAEKAWDTVNTIWRKHWHPDIGMYGKPPELEPAAEYALRQVGGFRRMNECLVEHVGFLRRDFIQAFNRFRETGGYLAPSRQEAAQLLDALRRGEIPESVQ